MIDIFDIAAENDKERIRNITYQTDGNKSQIIIKISIDF